MNVPRLEHASPSRIATAHWPGRRPRVPARVIAWWQSAELDRLLASGTAPAASAALSARARTITRARSRLQIAGGLARARRSARDTRPGLSAAIRPHADEILAARVVLGALDRRLRAAEPVTPRGMAMLRTLLTDGASALYAPSSRGALSSQLRAVAAALEPDGAPRP